MANISRIVANISRIQNNNHNGIHIISVITVTGQKIEESIHLNNAPSGVNASNRTSPISLNE
jgi:hypothetical protein